MSTFTLDLWFGYSINPDRRGVGYAVRMGALQACDIAESLGDDSPPRIVVRDFGRGRDGTSVVVAEFTATEHEEVDAVIKSISNRLGDSKQLRRAILRVPGGSSQDLRSQDLRSQDLR
jgi:hypothetical protein